MVAERTHEFVAKKKDFSDWYSQVVEAAGFIDRNYAMKGMFVWLPYGYKAMMNLKKLWDEMFQNAGIQEMYFPLLVPLEYCEINQAWWAGFKDEGYKAVVGNEVQGAIRPTGEPAMYPMFSQWVKTKADLPIRIYETVSSFRYETKETRPLIRDREITVWHEIHTAHATKEEADAEIALHVTFYDKIWNLLAMPVLRVNKPKWEMFPGAVGAYEYYSFISENGKVLENGSVNNLGQAYSKKFNIKFVENDKENFAWQVCTGNGGRLLAGVIATHGDDKGLIMPPAIAPVQVIIIPIMFKDKDPTSYAKNTLDLLRKAGVRAEIDLRDINAGRKFFDWEIKGVPLRIEIGPREEKNNSMLIVRRDNGEKIEAKSADDVKKALDSVHANLLDKASKKLSNAIVDVSSIDAIEVNAQKCKISRASWCGSEACYDKICVVEGLEGFGTEIKQAPGKCIACGKDAKEKLLIARSY